MYVMHFVDETVVPYSVECLLYVQSTSNGRCFFVDARDYIVVEFDEWESSGSKFNKFKLVFGKDSEIIALLYYSRIFIARSYISLLHGNSAIGR